MIRLDPIPHPNVPRHQPLKISLTGCENGRHSVISGSKVEVGGIIHATCRHCGCELMRLEASRRWFRVGQMGD